MVNCEPFTYAWFVCFFWCCVWRTFTDSPNESTLDYALGVFLGLSTIGLVSSTIGVSSGIIVSQPNFVKKVVFPLEILPTAMIGALEVMIC